MALVIVTLLIRLLLFFL